MLDPLLFRDRSCINPGMGNISSAFQDALAAQAKAALVDVVAANPKITAKDLGDLLASNPSLGSLTLNELLGAVEAKPARAERGGRRRIVAPPTVPAAARPSKGAAARKGGDGSAHKRNVRTEAGRDAFEAEVLEALKQAGGDNVSATQIRNAIDADPTQLRAALNRLIERGIATFTGQARGTRYSLV
jgi:hypothetical protein